MAKLQEIKVINVDEIPYAVDQLSAEIQASVELYNTWRQETEDMRVQFVKGEMALKTLGQDILTLIRTEQEKAAEAQAAASTDPIVGEIVDTPADPGC